MRFQKYLINERETINKSEVDDFVNYLKTKLTSYGVTEVAASNHWLQRLNHVRNNPPITIKELKFIMDSFLKKEGTQFKKDVENVKNNTAKKRGSNKKELNQNEFEYVIKSISTKIALTIVLKQDFHKKGTAVILPATIIRKKGFKVNKGIEVLVERKEL